MFALLLKIVRFHQGGPGVGGEVVAEVSFFYQSRSAVRAVGGSKGQQFHLRQLREAALGLRRKLPDRFDFIAEELNPVGGLGFGGENVEDASTPAELAGKLDCINSLEGVLHQPGREVIG